MNINLPTMVILVVLAAVVGLAIVKLIRDKKKGKCSCGCDCKSCGGCHLSIQSLPQNQDR